MAFGVDEEKPGRKWFFRIVSVAGIVAVIAAIGIFVAKGQALPAILLLFAGLAFAVLFAWSWTGSLFTWLASAKHYVEGVEGDHRHEWYAFKGQRVRVFLDEDREPWFPVSEIAPILELETGEKAFRHYGREEYAIPDSAPEPCLSERGLRRLIRYSAHREAGALGLWLDREVMRVLKNRRDRSRSGPPPHE